MPDETDAETDAARTGAHAEAEAAPIEDAVEAAAQVLADGVQDRLWIRALVPLLQLRSHETDPSSRVQFAFDLMHVAACERVVRLLRSDL